MDSAASQNLDDHEERLVRVEQHVTRADERHEALRQEVRARTAASDEEFWGHIHATDEKLRQIGRQNAALVEHLGEGDEDR